MSEHAPITEEVRKLARIIVEADGIPKEWWDEYDERKSKEIKVEWTAQLLADALKAEGERVRREASNHG